MQPSQPEPASTRESAVDVQRFHQHVDLYNRIRTALDKLGVHRVLLSVEFGTLSRSELANKLACELMAPQVVRSDEQAIAATVMMPYDKRLAVIGSACQIRHNMTEPVPCAADEPDEPLKQDIPVIRLVKKPVPWDADEPTIVERNP